MSDVHDFDHTLFSAGPLYDIHPSHGWTQIIERYEWSQDNSAELAKGWIRTADSMPRSPRSSGSIRPRWKTPSGGGTLSAKPGTTRISAATLMLAPIGPGPFYAVELSPSMLNTQGGPRRNETARIVRPNGTPIPRLYSAGELGSIYSYLYQGTGNIGECLAFGRVAGRNAAAETSWDA